MKTLSRVACAALLVSGGFDCVVLGVAAILCLASGNFARADEITRKRPMALLIMLDGLRADGIGNACTPNIDRLIGGRWMPGYECAWSMSGRTIADAAPNSAPNHTSIATGVDAAKHGVSGNGRTKLGNYADYPTWLTRVTEADRSRRGLYIFSWREDADCAVGKSVRVINDTDENNARTLPKILAGDDAPDATLYYVDLPDHVGHTFGFYPSGVSYLNAIWKSDRYVGAALDAIASRKTFEDEDWLIMITSDHGGYARSHGRWGGQCSTIPVILSGRHIRSGRLAGRPAHYDLTATALAHFGLDVAAMNLDGHVLTEAEKARPMRVLSDELKVYLAFDGKTPVNAVKDGPVPEIFGTNAVVDAKSGLVGGGLHLGGHGGLRLKGSEGLAFEHGTDFTMSVWVRLPQQQGDAPIVANKDWRRGRTPGVILFANGKVDRTGPGVCFNAAVGGKRSRIDMGTCVGDQGQWAFYAVTHDDKGVMTLYHGAPDGRFYWLCDEARDLVLKALPFHLGQDGTGNYTHALCGDLDEFALWTRCLDGDEVKFVFESTRRGCCATRWDPMDGKCR